MNPDKRPIRAAILFFNEAKPEAARMNKAISAALRARGVKVWRGGEGSLKEKLRLVDIAIAMGGDGTMLNAARALAPYSVPLLGINSGGLGFLSSTDAGEFRRYCDAILRGEFELEQRSLLSIEALRRGRRFFGPHLALNECVIRCGDQARAISLKTHCGGRFVADYFGDGIIVSTPTGSTAYALAASGPIVHPALDVFLLAPICPHTLTQRPLIIPADLPLSIALTTRRAHEVPRVLLSLDGQLSATLRVGDEVRLTRYEKPFKLIVNPHRSYYEVLHRKLKWGER